MRLWTRRHRAAGWPRVWAFSLCLLLVVGPLPAAPPMAATLAACPGHFAAGRAPEILRPALAERVAELCFEGYAVLHSGVSRTPLAVAEHLTRDRVAAAREVRREGNFREERRLPSDARARLADYARSGFDRGHMAPSGDMATPTAMAESFSLANMVPQNPGSNRCLWEGVESAVRRFAAEEGEIYVVTGPIFAGDSLERIGGRVLVPTSLYKAVYAPGRGAAAYVAPNAPGMAWRAVSLAELRDLAGIDVFPALPAALHDQRLALPEPRPSNVRGACKGQAAVASVAPAPAVAATRGKASLALLIGAGLFAVLMIILLLRVLGRR